MLVYEFAVRGMLTAGAPALYMSAGGLWLFTHYPILFE